MAARTLQQLCDAVRLLLMDGDHHTAPAQHEAAVLRGVTRLSQFRPRLRIFEIFGDSVVFRFSAPNDWQGGFSTVKKVLYPVDVTSKSLPPEISASEIQMMLQPDDTYVIHFTSLVPALGFKAHLYYTVEHVLTNTESSLRSTGDEDAVVYWAASELLRVMAAKVNASKDIEQLTAASNRESRGSQYLRLAELYEERSGLLEGPALGWGPINPGTAEQNTYLTH